MSNENDAKPAGSATRAELLQRAQALAEGGQAPAAEGLVRQALQSARAEHAAPHPETAQALILLAQVEAVQGKPTAGASAAEAVALLEASVGPEHGLTKQAKHIEGLLANAGQGNPFDALMQEVDRLLGGGEVEQALQLLHNSRVNAHKAGDVGAVASISGILAQVQQQLGNLEEAAEHAKEALELAERHGQGDAADHFRQLLASIEAGEGGAPEGVKEVAAAIQAAQKALEGGRFEEAAEAATKAAELSAGIGHLMAEANANVVLAQALLRLDKKEEARAPIERGAAIGEELGHNEIQQAFMALKMQLEMTPAQEALFGAMEKMQKGETEEGIKVAEAGLEGASAKEEAPLRGLLAQTYLERGEKELAATHARRAQELAEGLGDKDAANLFSKLAEVAEAPEGAAAEGAAAEEAAAEGAATEEAATEEAAAEGAGEEEE